MEVSHSDFAKGVDAGLANLPVIRLEKTFACSTSSQKRFWRAPDYRGRWAASVHRTPVPSSDAFRFLGVVEER
jgi:hypothetical protein